MYNEIHISTIERNTSENVELDRKFEPGTPASLLRCSAIELSRSINIHGPSRPTTTFLPLQSFFLLETNNKFMFILSGLI